MASIHLLNWQTTHPSSRLNSSSTLLAIPHLNLGSKMFQILIDRHPPDLSQYEEIYMDLHANPDLSDLEEHNANFIEGQFTKLSRDRDVKAKIGGFGLVATCKNGLGRPSCYGPISMLCRLRRGLDWGMRARRKRRMSMVT
jgi:hypothetical protein